MRNRVGRNEWIAGQNERRLILLGDQDLFLVISEQVRPYAKRNDTLCIMSQSIMWKADTEFTENVVEKGQQKASFRQSLL